MFSHFEKENNLRKEVGNVFSANNSINTKDKLDKTLSFWNNNYRFLLKSNVIILTGICNDTICAVEMIDIMKQLIKIELINNLKSFLPLSNKAFTYMEFSDDISAEKFRNLSARIADTKIFFINIEPPAMFINLFIDKLPASILAEYLPEILQQYGEIISINPTKMNLLNGNKCNTGSNKVCFRLNKTSTVNDIPYFSKIENIRIYIHIPTRPKICFRCTAKDHLVSGCTFRYCNTCHSYKDPLHSCYLSYASKVTQSRDLWHAALMKAQEECFQSDLGLLHDSEQGVLSDNLERQGHMGDGMEVDGNVDSSEPVISDSVEIGDIVSEVNSLPASPAEFSVGKIIGNEIVNPCRSAQMEEENGQECPSSSGDSGQVIVLTNKRVAREQIAHKNIKKKIVAETKKSYSLRNKSVDVGKGVIPVPGETFKEAASSSRLEHKVCVTGSVETDNEICQGE